MAWVAHTVRLRSVTRQITTEWVAHEVQAWVTHKVWLKHLQDSYESRIQPKLAEIASLRQELLSAKNELAKIKIQKQVESSHVPDSNENQSAQVDALKAKVSDTEQSLREGKQ